MPETVFFTPRRMSDSDWPAVESSFAHSFVDCRHFSIWEWRYRYPIVKDNNLTWYGWICYAPDESIAAYMGGRLLRGWVYGEVKNFIISQDNFSHPLWRGQRIGRRSIFAELEAAFLAAGGEVASLALGMGLTRRVRLGEQLGHIQTFTGGQWLQTHLVIHKSRSASCWVTLTDFSGEEWDSLWHQRCQSCQLCLIRDQKFLAWRFDPRQGRTYWRIAIHSLQSKPGQPSGYVVLAPDGQERAILVDAILTGSIDVFRDAWQQISAWLYRRGIRQVVGFFSHACPEFSFLSTLGFSPCPAPKPVVPSFFIFDPIIDKIRFNQEYLFTLADCDLY